VTIATLADIRTKIRRLTGSSNANILTDARIDDYIDSFYLYDLPAEFRSLQLADTLTFNTIRGINTYSLSGSQFQPADYPNGMVDRVITVEPPVYLSKREIPLYYNIQEFYSWAPSDQFTQVIATGDGTTGPFTGTLTSTPVIPSVNNDPTVTGYPTARVQNFNITANTSFGSTQNVTDIHTGGAGTSGTFAGDGTGNIDYSTGVINVTFSNAVPSGENIEVQYMSHSLTRPFAMLYHQNELTLWPPPDKGYIVEVAVTRQPSQVLADTAAGAGTPELNEWWELIAAGASKKIFQDRSDDDGIALMNEMMAERYHVAESRTYAQLGSQRAPTIFASQTANTGGAQYLNFTGE
jgi:hypothetical protein